MATRPLAATQHRTITRLLRARLTVIFGMFAALALLLTFAGLASGQRADAARQRGGLVVVPASAPAERTVVVEEAPMPVPVYVVASAEEAGQLARLLVALTDADGTPADVTWRSRVVVAAPGEELRAWAEILLLNSRRHHDGLPGVLVIDLSRPSGDGPHHGAGWPGLADRKPAPTMGGLQ